MIYLCAIWEKLFKMTQTYVYNGKEVYLTGRVASKTTATGRDRTLYEVKPIKYLNETGSLPSGIEDWVKLSDLYEINNDEESNDE